MAPQRTRRLTDVRRVAVPELSPYDADTALTELLERLRASLGATRVTAWRHDAEAGIAVPARQAISGPVAGLPDTVAVAASPFLTVVLGEQRAMELREGGRRATDRRAAVLGIRSAYAQPLVLHGTTTGVLTVEPAVAALPGVLRLAAPHVARALIDAEQRQAERRRVQQGETLLALVESAAAPVPAEDLLETACRLLAGLDGLRSATALSPGTPIPDFGVAVPLGREHGALVLEPAGTGPLPADLRRLITAVGLHLTTVLDGRPHPIGRIPTPREPGEDRPMLSAVVTGR